MIHPEFLTSLVKEYRSSAGRAQGIAPTMDFPLPKSFVGTRQGHGGEHGGGKHRHYYTRCARRAYIVVAVLASAMPGPTTSAALCMGHQVPLLSQAASQLLGNGKTMDEAA